MSHTLRALFQSLLEYPGLLQMGPCPELRLGNVGNNHVLEIAEVRRDSSYRCTRTGDCIYKDAGGQCTSLPRYIYLDRYGHYANMTAPVGKYRHRACVNYCQYRRPHKQVRDNPDNAKGTTRIPARVRSCK